MKKLVLAVLGVGLLWAVGLAQTPEALEAKLDDLAAKLTVLHYGTDAYGNWVQWLPTIYQDVQEIKAFRFEFGEFETEIIADLNKLESKLDAWIVEARAKFAALSEQLATHDADIKAAIAAAKTDILNAISAHDAAIKALLAEIEDKLDDETRFTDDTELAALQTALKAEIDANEAKIDDIEAKLDDAAVWLDARFDALDAAVAAIEGKLDALVIPDYSAELAAIEGKLDTGFAGLTLHDLRALLLQIINDIQALEAKVDQLLGP